MSKFKNGSCRANSNNRSASLLLLASGVLASSVVIANNHDASELEEVMVTGQKTKRSMQETTTSVDITTAKDLENYNIADLKDVFVKAANVTSTFGDSGFTIRGIANTNTSGVGIGDLATVYIDGAPMPRELVQGGSSDLWDVDQVEILRGPQSTLQGRNSLAGAVIVNTVNPSYDWNGRVRLQAFDESAERRIGLAVGGPIIDDQVAFRLAGEWQAADGFTYNPTRKEYASDNGATMYRAKLLIEPDAVPDLSVLLSHTVDDREGPQTLSLSNPPQSGWSNRKIFSDLEYKNDTKLMLSILNLNYDVSDTVTFSSISTLNEVSRTRQRDGDFSAKRFLSNVQHMNPKTFTQEFRFNIDTDQFSAVFGTYYSKLDDKENDGFSRRLVYPADVGLEALLNKNPKIPKSVIPNIVALYDNGVAIDFASDKPVEIETKALFGDITWFATERFKLFAGLRYDKETQKITTVQKVTVIDLPAENALGNQLAPIVKGVNGFLLKEAADATKPDSVNDSSFNELLPKLGFGYDITDDMNIAFVVQRGYRSGGVGVNSASSSVYKFEPEFTWNYELSYRSQWLDNRLTANANMFYIDWKDQQVHVFLSNNRFDAETRNAGSSRLFGFELEVEYAITDNIQVFSSIGRVDTKFLDFKTNIKDKTKDYSGNQFAAAPKLTFAIGGNVHINKVYFSADLSQSSKSYSQADTDQSKGPDLKELSILNAKMGYKSDTYGVYLIAKNLFNFEYSDNSFETKDGTKTVRYGNPRVIGLSFEADF